MSKHFYFTASLAIAVQAVSLGQSPGLGGMIRGSVILDSSGKGVPAATVMLAQIAAPTRQRIQPQVLYSGKDGSFFFSQLPPGKYQVCARLSQSNLLDPCDWEPKLNIYFLATDQLVPNARIVLKEGVLLPVRLDDPTDFVSNNQGKRPGSHVLLGVPLPNGAFLPVTPSDNNNSSKGGKEHQILIPLDRDVRMIAASRDFQLSDPSGKKMRDGEPAPGQAISASSGKILNRGSFNVRVNKGQGSVAKVNVSVTGLEAQ